MISRRRLLQAAPGAGALLSTQALLPAWALTGDAGTPRREFDLAIRRQAVNIDGQPARIVSVNGTLRGVCS